MDFGTLGSTALIAGAVSLALNEIVRGIYGSMAAAPRLARGEPEQDARMTRALQEQWDSGGCHYTPTQIAEVTRQQSNGRAIKMHPLKSGDRRDTLMAFVYRSAPFLEPSAVLYCATRHSGEVPQDRWYAGHLPDLIAREKRLLSVAQSRAAAPQTDTLAPPDNIAEARRRLGDGAPRSTSRRSGRRAG